MKRRKNRHRMTQSTIKKDIRHEFAVYVDGSCRGNGTDKSSMAYGYKFTDIATGKQQEKSGHIGPGTNNLAELYAIKYALEGLEEYCKEHNYKTSQCSVTIYSDSQYAIETIEGRYRVKHHSSLVYSIQDCRKFWGKIRYEKIAAHSGHIGNIYVDKLANSAHPKKRVFYVTKKAQAFSSDAFDFILDNIEEIDSWEGSHGSFPLKAGKEYEIKVVIKEM